MTPIDLYLNYTIMFYALNRFHNAPTERVHSCYSPLNRQDFTVYYCHFKANIHTESVVHHIKSLSAVFGSVYVRVDAVKYPQGSNQVFKVKGNSVHYRQSIKKSWGL